MNKNKDTITINLSTDEAIVLSEFLKRFSENDSLTIEDQAEQRVLWDIECLLEKEIVSDDWQEELGAARARVRDEE